MSKIGFIGLGIMGRPMAGHLLDAGHELTTVKRGSLDETLASKGMKELDNPKAVAEGAEVVITMVPDTPMSKRCCSAKVVSSKGSSPAPW
ncbi:2-hydroxy-3-oxopropionate reductase [Halomonas elongata]|uniref:2-hydroxy-3-oxopropionate reductase n=1 Tax=Halomonas elongata TaxID=2746 RepID=A0A1B8P651_HALEL|nr:2-hydroxy-3-oxopropionate reductase [Halomonas elongata]